jgi:tetraacyldisaccharide 4'-kinase
LASVRHRVNPHAEQYFRDVTSGSETGPRATALRAGLGVAEPFYSAASRLRNWLFDAGIRKVHRLPVPVVSIGNITTGGTGKTPMVRWLAEQLRGAGHRPAILSRGYRAQGAGLGDELTMLDRQLNGGTQAPIFLRANPDRVAGGQTLLAEHPEVDFLVLDDAFQHRRIARDLDIVLISAASPFGFGHVLPRGLLREPLTGLRRAGAIVITHADQFSGEDLAGIETQIRRHAPTVPIYRASHEQFGLREAGTGHSMEELVRRRYFVFGGIANPQNFAEQLAHFAPPAGYRWFPDHHAYTANDLQSLEQTARAVGAEILVTTEKDWAKIEPLPSRIGLRVWRVQMEIRFADDHEQRLLRQVSALSPSPSERGLG